MTSDFSIEDGEAALARRLGGSTFVRRTSLRAVDRAAGDLRRGDFVLVRPDRGPALLVQACEAVSDDGIAEIRRVTRVIPSLVITLQRAAALGLAPAGSGVLQVDLGEALTADLVRDLSDPTRLVDPSQAAGLWYSAVPADGTNGLFAAAQLAKLARLLPAVLTAPVDRPFGTERLAAEHDVLSVGAYDIEHYQAHAAASLTRVSEARVPLAGAEDTRIIAFRPHDGGQEHLAIIIGRPEQRREALVRLHSECFTGDLLGSLRCDCGEQLRGAVEEIARQGAGVLLYLAQEGRGVGLVNKLRAYRLQDIKFDTVDANEMLGYDADERLYLPAAAMLRALGLTRVRLMTNNPEKVSQLAQCGIEVTERVPHIFPANGHNEFYLQTKKQRSGHFL